MSAMDEKKLPRSPFRWLFDSMLLLLGAVIALNVAICYVKPIWSWVVGIVAGVALLWIVVAVARWRRNRW